MNQNQIFRPFGPSIAKFIMPTNIIEKINEYVESIIEDEKKLKSLDHGHKLAGNVKQEFKLEPSFLKDSGFLNFLAVSTAKWIELSEKKKIKNFNVSSSWVVRQFENEYNPLHFHGGHISGVGYLKLPESFGETFQNNKTSNYNGKIAFVHGNQIFNSNSMFNVKPKVGEFYFFPHYLLHTVYPFYDSKEERRSVSFNATIDENIYNTYNTYG